LKKTAHFSLRYKIGSGNINNLYLSASADSDYCSNLLDRKSFTGYIVKLGPHIINWESQKQKTQAHSTAEAELMAIDSVVRDLKFQTFILDEIFGPDDSPIEIFSDSQAAIALAENDMSNKRTKHIDTKFFYCRELLEQNFIRFKYVDSASQVSDVMTKPLGPLKHKYCIERMFKTNT